ncbi:TetR/AcrR family transcriptional regulator [Herbiconiux sp. P16]|uniref:TetR/AcrR family transcriptional regulator n=1 Tax=Herbiconiux wuyangfengii TaxID=3342794 RepID=UPI0035B83BBC
MPRAGVTADRVAEEAEQLADEVGLESVTLAAVAGRLGIKLPSLYKHIDSLGGLRATVGERATLELTEVMVRATVGKAGPDAVSALAHALRDWAREHPGRYAATITAPRVSAGAEPGQVRAAEDAVRMIFTVLDGFGLEGDDAVDATRGLRAVLHGFVALEAAGGFGMPADVDRSFDRLVAAYIRSLPAY